MNKRALNIGVSLIVAGLFIWLAIRNVDLSELGSLITSVSLHWVPLFVAVLLTSHFIRAERWRLLLKEDQRYVSRSTLFAGVMLGYFVNNFIPRLGEVSRPIYVAKKNDLSTGNLIGTIVLERLVDVFSMFLIVGFVAVYLSKDFGLLEQMFGIDQWSRLVYLVIPVFLILCIFIIWLVYRLLSNLEKRNAIRSPLLMKILEILKSFTEGMNSLRNVNNWPVFLLFTGAIWLGYILMAWLPFSMLDLGREFSLGFNDAMVLTIVSSIGVSIPTPAGIGSYHLLIQQSMWLLYSVPLSTALTYATVTHAATFLVVLVFAPIALWWDKYYTLKSA